MKCGYTRLGTDDPPAGRVEWAPRGLIFAPTIAGPLALLAGARVLG
jgi:hypothetical protein